MIRIFSHTVVKTSNLALQHTRKFITKLHVHNTGVYKLSYSLFLGNVKQ
jgi:hypothetical protein